MMGHLAEIERVVEVEFRQRKAPPNKEYLEFIQKCEIALPAGGFGRSCKPMRLLTKLR